jgi:hypothetical protein
MGGAISAQAQQRYGSDTDLGTNWDFRMGFFVPENSAARTQEGDVWFTIGAERAVYEVERWKASISVDYYGSGSLYNVPITINARGTSHGMRYGAGAGVGVSHDLNQGILGFAYNVLVGYTLMKGRNEVVFDIQYHGLSTGANALNGWGFTLGYHF